MIRLIFATVCSVFVLGIGISSVYGQRLNDNYFGTYPSNFEDQRLNKLVEEKKYGEARALCDDMLRQRPGFADCHLQMSKIAAAEGRLEAAMTAAVKAVAVGPKNGRAHLQLAGLLETRGDLDGAIVHLRQALALEPNAPDTRVNCKPSSEASSHPSESGVVTSSTRRVWRIQSVSVGCSSPMFRLDL